MISFTQNKAKVVFNNSIYIPKILERAVKDFSSSCKIKISKEALASYVTITSKKEDIREITNEFCNYVLALMKDVLVGKAHYIKNG